LKFIAPQPLIFVNKYFYFILLQKYLILIYACRPRPWLLENNELLIITAIFSGCAGLWGVLAVGIFALDPQLLNTTRGRSGLLHGEGSSRVPTDFFISMACIKVAKSDIPEEAANKLHN
jgi:hypothetical protein